MSSDSSEPCTYDVICITEIKPKYGHTPDPKLLQLDGYELYVNTAYNSPDTRGVAIYVKQDLDARVIVDDVTSKFKDAAWIEIHSTQKEKLLVGCIYRSGSPAKAVKHDADLHKMMSHMATDAGFKDVLMVGDFNHPNILWTPTPVITSNHNDNHPDVQFVEAVNDSMLHQHVTKVTRDREHQTSTLDDLILTTDPDLVSDIEHLGHLGASDHQCLQFQVNFLHTKTKATKTKRLLYHKADFPKLKTLLSIDWDSELSNKTPDEQYNVFLSKHNAAIQQSVPTVTINSNDKWNKPVWMKKATQRLIKRKHRTHTTFLNTRNANDKTAYNVIRNEVTSKVRTDRIAFERNISKEIKNNNKVFWRYVNANRSSRAAIPELKRPDGTKACSDEEKAEALNNQFSSVFTKEDTTDTQDAELNNQHTLSTLTITEERIQKKLSKMRTDKSPGPDGVHPLILKNLADILSKPLAKIFNNSVQSGLVPTEWKQGVVTAIYKKGEKCLPANYRAITLTSVICKLLEEFITEYIKQHLITSNRNDKSQHGFTSKKSTVTNLIAALNIWTESLSHGLPVDIIYLDFEKAFDKVPHERLLSQLTRYGVTGNLHSWIRDYLHNRTQKVRVNGSFSSTAPVLSGVPQGSVLGPALFLVFVADASQIIKNFISLYADDTKLFSYILDASCAANLHTAESLQLDLNSLAVWCDDMLMSYNIEKCHSLHLGKHNHRTTYVLPKMSNLKKSSGGLTYDYTFHPLDKVNQEKDLGVIIDDQLSFRNHMSSKISKANTMIYLIKHTFKFLDSDMFNMLYKALVRPQVEYATPVWCPTLKMDINAIEKVQHRATKLVPEIANLSYEERLKHLKLPTLQYRRLRQDLIFIYKHTQNLIDLDTRTHCPVCIHNQDMLPPSLSQRTRGHNHKFQVQHHQGIRNKFLTSRCIPTWNNLKCDTVNATSINRFKNLLSTDLSMPNKYV